MAPATALPRQWRQDQYLVSTSQALLSHQAINAALETGELFWAHALDPANLAQMLENSLCFGLYVLRCPPSAAQQIPLGATANAPSSQGDSSGDGEIFAPEDLEQIGLARAITDHTTFAYLTDVYVLPDYQAKGLGKWLAQCVDEMVRAMPELRRIMLATSSPHFWAKTLGVESAEQKDGIMLRRAIAAHV